MTDYEILRNKIMECGKFITELLKNSNLLIMGAEVGNNISGDKVKKLDLEANNYIKNIFLNCNLVRTITSEEEENLVFTKFSNAPYMISFDPIDGSSNIDVNITVGTIFCIYRYDNNNNIMSGRNIFMSGYTLYGSSSQLILAYYNNLCIYSLIKNNYQLIKNNLKIPVKVKYILLIKVMKIYF